MWIVVGKSACEYCVRTCAVNGSWQFTKLDIVEKEPMPGGFPN